MLSRIDDPFFLDSAGPERPLVVFLGDGTDDEDHDILFPALRDRGVAVIRVHPEELVVRLDRDRVTFAVRGREMAPDLVVGWVLDELLFPGMTQLDVFARAGVPVINDAITLFRAQNKLLDSSMLAAAGALRYPVISGRDTAELGTWLDGLDGAAVVKPLYGHGGRGIERIDAPAARAALISRIENDGRPYYAMPWIENPGRDIRVYTVNHRAVFAMYRYAPPGKWITNVLAGGLIAMCPLTEDIAHLAERASRGAGTLIGGVDIAENLRTGELVVYEVNSCPTCEPPVLEMIADFLAAAAEDLDAALETWRPSRVHTDFDGSPDLFHASKRGRLHQPS
jgi:[lysine-biosynthesis-protein LysW]--L-2-aminoadipate ligase/ribosomal protein S6--L-glutamate ligase